VKLRVYWASLASFTYAFWSRDWCKVVVNHVKCDIQPQNGGSESILCLYKSEPGKWLWRNGPTLCAYTHQAWIVKVAMLTNGMCKDTVMQSWYTFVSHAWITKRNCSGLMRMSFFAYKVNRFGEEATVCWWRNYNASFYWCINLPASWYMTLIVLSSCYAIQSGYV